MKLILILLLFPFTCSKQVTNQPPPEPLSWHQMFLLTDSLYTPIATEMISANVRGDQPVADYITANWSTIQPKLNHLTQQWAAFKAKKGLSDSALYHGQFSDSVKLYLTTRPGWDIGPEPWQNGTRKEQCDWNELLRNRELHRTFHGAAMNGLYWLPTHSYTIIQQRHSFNYWLEQDGKAERVAACYARG